MNLPRLAQHLQDQGIMGKPFVELSREEVIALVRACWDAADAEDVRCFPYFREVGGQRELVSPCDAPTVFRTWLYEDGWIEMYHLLQMLGATNEEVKRYLGPDWLERMHKRTKFKVMSIDSGRAVRDIAHAIQGILFDAKRRNVSGYKGEATAKIVITFDKDRLPSDCDVAIITCETAQKVPAAICGSRIGMDGTGKVVAPREFFLGLPLGQAAEGA